MAETQSETPNQSPSGTNQNAEQQATSETIFVNHGNPSLNDSEKVRTTGNTSLVAPGALPHRLQCCTAFKIQNWCQGAPKWPKGSGKESNSRLLAAPNQTTFAK